MMFYFKFADN